jgi:hypothetical protein
VQQFRVTRQFHKIDLITLARLAAVSSFALWAFAFALESFASQPPRAAPTGAMAVVGVPVMLVKQFYPSHWFVSFVFRSLALQYRTSDRGAFSEVTRGRFFQ